MKYKLFLKVSKDYDGRNIYRYTGIYFKDITQWRYSENKALSDIQGVFYRFCDRAKGLDEVLDVEKLKKENCKILNK